MRIYKTRWFTKWAKKEGLGDAHLTRAIAEMNDGLVDADLGGYVYKKRVPIPGQGKRASFRILLTFKVDDKAFFMYGFAKNKLANISKKELKALKLLAQVLLDYGNESLAKAIITGEIIEVEFYE